MMQVRGSSHDVTTGPVVVKAVVFFKFAVLLSVMAGFFTMLVVASSIKVSKLPVQAS